MIRSFFLLLASTFIFQAHNAFAKCGHAMLRSADYKNTPFAVPGRKSPELYYYLVKKDFKGDGSDIQFVPIVSKDWNLSDTKLRDLARNDGYNPKGTRVSIVRSPVNSDDHKTLEAINYNLDSPNEYCERAEKFQQAVQQIQPPSALQLSAEAAVLEGQDHD